MPNELKTLPTGEVVLRNEADFANWSEQLSQECRCEFPDPPPKGYPCLAVGWDDDCGGIAVILTYLSDAEAMVSALKEA